MLSPPLFSPGAYVSCCLFPFLLSLYLMRGEFMRAHQILMDTGSMARLMEEAVIVLPEDLQLSNRKLGPM